MYSFLIETPKNKNSSALILMQRSVYFTLNKVTYIHVSK